MSDVIRSSPRSRRSCRFVRSMEPGIPQAKRTGAIPAPIARILHAAGQRKRLAPWASPCSGSLAGLLFNSPSARARTCPIPHPRARARTARRSPAPLASASCQRCWAAHTPTPWVDGPCGLVVGRLGHGVGSKAGEAHGFNSASPRACPARRWPAPLASASCQRPWLAHAATPWVTAPVV